MSELEFEVTISSEDFLKKVEQIKIGIRSLSGELMQQEQQINLSFNQQASAFSQLFADMTNCSVADMRSIANEAQKMLDYVKGGDFQVNDEGNGLYGISKETFDMLKQSPVELANIQKSIMKVRAEADDCDVAFVKIGKGLNQLFKSDADPEKVKAALAEIESGMGEVMKAGKFLSDSLAKIGESFGNETVSKVANDMNAIMDTVGSTMSGAQAGMAFGPWGAAAGAAIGLVTSLSSSLSQLHDDGHEENIQNIQQQVVALENSYGTLSESLDSAYSLDASNLIDQQNKLLEQQKELIRNQVVEEQGKKNVDDGRIKEWKQQVEDINVTIKKNKEAQIDAIFGEDLKTSIDKFARAYADAWSMGENRAKASKDIVKNMIREMVVAAIEGASSKPMEDLRKKLASFLENDGIIDSAELEIIKKDAANIAKILDERFEWANEFMVGDKKTGDVSKIKADVIEKEKQLFNLLNAQQEERIQQIKDWKNENCQAEIDGMEDVSSKKLSQMAFNHRLEMQELEREKKEFLENKVRNEEDKFNKEEDVQSARDPNRKRGTFDASKVQLDSFEVKWFDDRKVNAIDRYGQRLQIFFDSEKQTLNESLRKYGTYLEKRQAIIDIYNDKIANAKLPVEKTALREERDKILAGLDEEALKSTSVFGQLFSDMKERSVKDMRSIATEAERALAYLQEGTFKVDSEGNGLFGISEDKFNILKETPDQFEGIKGGIKNLNVEANNSDTALTKMKQGFDDLFNSKGDPKNMQATLSQIQSSLGAATQAGRFFSDSLANIGDSFGNEKMGKVADGMNVAMDAASAAMSGAQAGMALGPWGAAAGAAIGLVSSLSSSLSELHDAKHEKTIQDIQEQIEVLEETYEKLGDSLEKAYSSDASELIEQQNQLLEQQKVLIQNQIAEEQSKKKADGGRIEEWQKKIEDIDATIGKNKEKKIDAIFGEDLKAAIDNFAQAYADAWAAGDDRAKSSKDLVKGMIKQMVTEAIKAASSEPMAKLREKLAGFFSDGIVSAWEREQIEKDAEELANKLDKKYGWADEYMKEGDEVGSSSQSSSNEGFKGMSQETGDELNGRFTALQIANEEIRNSMLFVVANLTSLTSSVADGSIALSEMRNLAVISNSYLQDIAGYTKRILMDFGVKLDDISNNTKRL